MKIEWKSQNKMNVNQFTPIVSFFNMKHIVAFSGGAASAKVAQMIAEKYPTETILLYHSTKTEPADNDRFRQDVADMIGLPITEDSDGRDIWQVFEDENFLNGHHAPCSRILKQERSLAFCLKNAPTTLYFGYSLEEGDRAQRTYARYLAHGIETRFPLIEQNISKEMCLHTVQNCWGLRLPETYAWAEHANCIPCVKGGQTYWGLIAIKYPEIFERAAKLEEALGQYIRSEGYLREIKNHCIRLATRYLEKKDGCQRQGKLFLLPCECGN